MRKGLLKTTITALVICAIIILLQDVFAQDSAGVMKVLCNSFFSVGVFFICIGAMDFCSQEGAFDIFGFSLQTVFATFKKNPSDRKYKTYSDYKKARHPEDARLSVSPCLIVGPIITIISLVFLFIYNRMI